MWVRVAALCLDPGAFLLPNLAPVFYKTTKNVFTKRQTGSYKELLREKKRTPHYHIHWKCQYFLFFVFSPNWVKKQSKGKGPISKGPVPAYFKKKMASIAQRYTASNCPGKLRGSA